MKADWWSGGYVLENPSKQPPIAFAEHPQSVIATAALGEREPSQCTPLECYNHGVSFAFLVSL